MTHRAAKLLNWTCKIHREVKYIDIILMHLNDIIQFMYIRFCLQCSLLFISKIRLAYLFMFFDRYIHHYYHVNVLVSEQIKKRICFHG